MSSETRAITVLPKLAPKATIRKKMPTFDATPNAPECSREK